MWEYGRAVVEDRRRPQHLAELREYLRWEYGLGTEPEAYLAEAARRAPRPESRVRRALTRVLRALAKAVGTQASSNGRRPGGGSPESTR